MPFELGLDHACARFGSDPCTEKAVLILEHDRYDYQRGLSDIAGWDIHAHNGDIIKIIRIVRDWLVHQAAAIPIGSSRIRGDYVTLQEWYWERELHLGASDEDIKAYPTVQVVAAMREWVDAGRPVTASWANISRIDPRRHRPKVRRSPGGRFVPAERQLTTATR